MTVCMQRVGSPPDDIRTLALPVLRHRVLVNYRAEAEGISVDNIVERLLAHVKA